MGADMDTDDRFTPRPIAAWFIIAAVASLLFMGLLFVAFLLHVLADPGSMPLDQRNAFLAEPSWVKAAYAVAALLGLGGAFLLIARRKIAEWVLLVALVGALVHVAGFIVVTPLREMASANDLLFALVIAAISWTIYWFARHSRMRGWLR